MPPPERTHTYAAVDLGSNSFHLLVARRSHGELQVLDRIKESVRLGGGLDRRGRLDRETRERALECLARFGQRLRGIPHSNIRAVGTQTFRRLARANEFLALAEDALGCPVDVIGGREEARLIYLGVTQGVAGMEEQRLVVDIGGGSTELVIGKGLEPLALESVQSGCVSLTRWYFQGGRISAKRWHRGFQAASAELQELQNPYRALGWNTVVGSSGTVRAIATICQQKGWTERDVTRESLERLRDALLVYRRIEDIDFPGMSERRRGVIAGGIMMLSACFDSLGIERMTVSPFALREGVLHDLLGRLEQRDPREKTVRAFRARYEVDASQAKRVERVALTLFDPVAEPLRLRPIHRRLLGWAAELHETGLGISHSQYERHSAYLVAESDMAGFSRQEQGFLAALVGHHRREIPPDFGAGLPERLHTPLLQLLVLLRLAWVFCRTRDDSAIPSLRISTTESGIRLAVSRVWAAGHPLTVTDLEFEQVELRKLGFSLEVDHDAK